MIFTHFYWVAALITGRVLGLSIIDESCVEDKHSMEEA
jgi:hypothetical protein